MMIGSDGLLPECARQWRDRGHEVTAIVSDQPAIAKWAGLMGIPVLKQATLLKDAGLSPFDYLFNLSDPPVLPAPVLAMPRRAAIHVHDGLLPGYAGLDAPVWALLHGERRHGISWHLIDAQPGADDLLLTHSFHIEDDDSAVSLKAKCLIAARGSFSTLIAGLATGSIIARPHSKSASHSHGHDPRPADAGMIDWHTDAHRIAHMVRALDHGAHANRLVIPKISMNGHVLLVGTASVQDRRSSQPAGTILSVQPGAMVVATATRDLQIGRITTCEGLAVSLTGRLARDGYVSGAVLDRLSVRQRHDLSALSRDIGRLEPWWRHRLTRLRPLRLPLVTQTNPQDKSQPRHADLRGLCPEGPRSPADRTVMAALVGYLGRIAEQKGRDHAHFDLGYADPVLRAAVQGYEPWFAAQLPLNIGLHFNHGLSMLRETLGADIREVRRRIGHAADLFARMPSLRRKGIDDPAALPVAILIVDDLQQGAPHPGADLTIALRSDSGACRWFHDAQRLNVETIAAMQAGFRTFLNAAKAEPDIPIASLPLICRDNMKRQIEQDRPARPHDLCHHQLFTRKAQKAAGSPAITCNARTLTFGEVDRRTDDLAQHLLGLGVKTDALVGLHMGRSANMVIALLAIHKAGGACVPLSPGEPSEHIARILSDCRPAIVVTDKAGMLTLPCSDATVLCLDDNWEPLAGHCDLLLPDIARPHHLACLNYSTAAQAPFIGAMVEHRNLANVLCGMDRHIPEPGIWLAVTDLKFDRCILELCWGLSRGCHVILAAPGDGFDAASRQTDVRALTALMVRHGVTHLCCAPELAQRMVDDKAGMEQLARTQTLFLAGEPVPAELAQTLHALMGERATAIYGTVETTAWHAAHRLDGAPGRVPLGRPLAHQHALVLDSHQQPLPPGLPGELAIGGEGVARGYLGRPDLNAKRFIPHPILSGAMVYRTGLRVQQLSDGTLQPYTMPERATAPEGARPDDARSDCKCHGGPCDRPGDEQATCHGHEAAAGAAWTQLSTLRSALPGSALACLPQGMTPDAEAGIAAVKHHQREPFWPTVQERGI
ncbi:non-ribosomal peptide synthetase component F/methionyl-tRNA formyltransferase [Novosphingobium sp. SG751A]|nr:non-ribosomal peptide synthetase component F/methionyl-tRNA formyltransferase [Novosphingobium sp. SG751A]